MHMLPSVRPACPRQAARAGAGNDFQKDQQFKKLNAARASYDVKVLRGGASTLVPNTGERPPLLAGRASEVLRMPATCAQGSPACKVKKPVAG